MADVVSWSVPLGRWLGTTVRLHWLFLAYAASALIGAATQAEASRAALVETLAWLGMLFLATVVREGGSLLLLARLGVPGPTLRLWPLGAFVSANDARAGRTAESALLAASSLATSFALALGVMLGLALMGARPQLNPFGGPDGGAPLLPSGAAAVPFTALWWVGWFGWLNWVLFLANLMPALPFDAGRILRGWWGVTHRERDVFPYFARACAVVVGLVGMSRLYFGKPGWLTLIMLALLMELLVRHEARRMEETGYLEEGLFGYDFSQGYTSLEAGPSVARPKRQSALRRWRERRSEARRRRRLEQENAEAARLDEILQKLHREGRASLLDEEQRFLARASHRLRQRRTKEGD